MQKESPDHTIRGGHMERGKTGLHRNSGEESIGKWIAIVSKHMHYVVHKKLEKFEKYNFGRGEFKFLVNIYEHEGICQEDLAEILKSHKYEVAKGIKKLVNRGLIKRIRDPEDKRIYRLYPTKEALAMQDDFMKILSDTTTIITRDFSPTEKELLLDFLIRMANNIHTEASHLKSGY